MCHSLEKCLDTYPADLVFAWDCNVSIQDLSKWLSKAQNTSPMCARKVAGIRVNLKHCQVSKK